MTGSEEYRRIAREVLDYVALEMTAPSGAFYSATDADSQRPDGEMEEGWFFTWTPDELQTVLGPERAQVVSKYYGVTPQGNFEGRNILHRPRSLDAVARELGISKANLQKHLGAARGQLYAARAKRPPPLRDAKIISAWNGLMISAFARGGLVLNDPTYVEAARVFAVRILREGGDNTYDRIRWAWQQAVLRNPDARELATLRDLVKKHAAEYAADRDSAEALLKVGLKPVPEDIDAAELATWTSVARVILNLHETVTRS